MPNPDGSVDVNAISIYQDSNGKTLTYDTIDGSKGTAALKITSKATDVHVSVAKLIGGSENCCDENNLCNGITVTCDVYEIHGKYAVSAKTCNNVTFIGHLTGTPSQWHVNLGSYSDQSGATQTNTHLALTADIYPILVWVGNSEVPTFDDATKYKVIGFGRYGSLVRGFVMFFWKLGKKLGLPI